MEGKSRKWWKKATKARKWTLKPQSSTVVPTFFISSFPLFLPTGSPDFSLYGPQGRLQQDQVQQNFREPSPQVYYCQSLNYKPQRNVSMAFYAQRAHINTSDSLSLLFLGNKSASSTGRGHFSGYLLNDCQGTYQPRAGRIANPRTEKGYLPEKIGVVQERWNKSFSPTYQQNSFCNIPTVLSTTWNPVEKEV